MRKVPVAIGGLAFVAYASTAARTITWWDGSSYPLAAATLGIPGAPGSLMLTLLGWVVTRIPIASPIAFRLNLFAALLVAMLVGLVCWLGARLATPEGREPGALEWTAGSFAALTFAFSATPWTYATQFTPYGLSALWTALILLAALAWWRRPAGSSGSLRLFLLFLLFGLDLSVHRTNLLLLPAALLWVALRTPRSHASLRDVGAGIAGFLLGVAFHLLLIPMAARNPAFMIEDTHTWDGWWSYVSLERTGGAFLVNIYPRTANFFSVQVADYLAFLRRNLSPPVFLPAVLAAAGWLLILRHHPRRAIGLLGFFLFAGPGAVVYFNLPRHYMRPIDRHYLPSLVILAPWIAVAAAALLRGASRLPARIVLAPAAAALLALVPFASWRSNRESCDLSRVRFAETFARDLLESLPKDAILFTSGDNDTFPLWYLQQIASVRSDVRVVSLPLSNTGLYVTQLRQSDPDFARLLEGTPLPRVIGFQRAPEELTAPVAPVGGLGLPPGRAIPEEIRFQSSGIVIGQDLVALDILRLNRWKRPVFLACTVSPASLEWLWPYARLDGLAYRIIPSTDSTVRDLDHLRETLLEHVSYAGVADTTILMDTTSRVMCSNYFATLIQLAQAQLERGRADDARATLQFLEARTPPDRLGIDEGVVAGLRERIEGRAAQR